MRYTGHTCTPGRLHPNRREVAATDARKHRAMDASASAIWEKILTSWTKGTRALMCSFGGGCGHVSVWAGGRD